MSQAIADLPEGGVYLGGGEVDLKLWVNVKEFIEMYKPFVLDCTFPRDLLFVCSTIHVQVFQINMIEIVMTILNFINNT